MSFLQGLAPPKVRITQGFSLGQRLIHWSVPALCIAQIPTSWAIQRTHLAHGFTRPDPFDLFLHQVHAWVGWLVMLLALLSVLLRYSHGRPSLADCSSLWERRAAEATHVALYGLLLLLPATGTVAMYLSFRVAPIHRFLSWMLLIVALGHVAAALWHHLYRRDDILRRMLGVGTARKREGTSQKTLR